MITILAKFDKNDPNYHEALQVLPVKKGFEKSVNMWDMFIVSVDSEKIVIGYSETYKHISQPFVDEEYFKNSSNFIIVEETDPNLSQKIKYYCHDKKNRLVYTKVNHHPGFKIEWNDIVSYSNKRRLKILSFLDKIEDDENGKKG